MAYEYQSRRTPRDTIGFVAMSVKVGEYSLLFFQGRFIEPTLDPDSCVRVGTGNIILCYSVVE